VARTSRVSYFQNVFDLLDYQPPVSPVALAAIEATEARIGRRLPAALRDWYSREGVVEIGPAVEDWQVEEGHVYSPLPGPGEHNPATWTEQLWYNYVGNYESYYATPDSLTSVLAQIDGRVNIKGRQGRFARVLIESYDLIQWWVEWTGPDDPPVWCDVESDNPALWSRAADRFSDFVFNGIVDGYLHDSTPIACEGHDPEMWVGKNPPPNAPPAPPKPYQNGLWLRAPEEPLAPPVLDYLSEQLGEP